MQLAAKNRKISLEAYFAYDDALEGKSEYYDGEVFDMAGGTPDHSLICNNFGALLFAALAQSGCRTYNSDLKVEIASAKAIVYPDITVVSGQVEYSASRKDIVRNPRLVVEVVSEGSGGYDGGAKFFKYTTVASLREFVMVEQSRAAIHVASRKENGLWEINLYAGLEGSVHLQSLEVRLAMADIYRDVGVA